MEKLPAEIKLEVIKLLDLPTLKSLVHASSIYHAVYLSQRTKVLVPLALQHLDKKGLNPAPPSQWQFYQKTPNTPHYRRYCHVCVRSSVSTPETLSAAFDEYFQQFEVRSGPVKLSLESCTVLLAVNGVLACNWEDGYHRFSEKEQLQHTAGHFHHFSSFANYTEGQRCRWRHGHSHHFLSWRS